MVTSAAQTVTEYLASLPAERRKELAAVRAMIKKKLPKGYKEVMRWGMIVWEIPFRTYPSTHNSQPLCYAALTVQKRHLSLYLMGAYMHPEQTAAIKAAFKAAGKKLDMGKSCIRFRRAEDLPLAALGKAIAAIPPVKYIVRYEELTRK